MGKQRKLGKGNYRRWMIIMKALSIKEPWVYLFIMGKKTIETRRWKTNYRGKLLLCASKKPKSEYSGYAFATAILKDCIPMTKEHELKACISIYDNAYSWILSDIKPIKKFEVTGKLGLFNVDCESFLEEMQ